MQVLSKEVNLALSFVYRCYGNYEDIELYEVVNTLMEDFCLTKDQIKYIILKTKKQLNLMEELQLDAWVNEPGLTLMPSYGNQ